LIDYTSVLVLDSAVCEQIECWKSAETWHSAPGTGAVCIYLDGNLGYTTSKHGNATQNDISNKGRMADYAFVPVVGE
jgi:hypothetical protein